MELYKRILLFTQPKKWFEFGKHSKKKSKAYNQNNRRTTIQTKWFGVFSARNVASTFDPEDRNKVVL